MWRRPREYRPAQAPRIEARKYVRPDFMIGGGIVASQHEQQRTGPHGRRLRYDYLLLALFLLTLPLCNPWVRGDGVGYYAYARSMLIEKRLNFESDWEHGNESFGLVDDNGHPLPEEYTPTGRIRNIWAIGPSILWFPFLLISHSIVLAADRFGAHIPADGFSAPYRTAMAVGTAIYGFLSLWISFLLSREYFAEKWAFLACVGIWGASSLPVYMYFNPSWSHAHSAFVVALFIWYWHRTRGDRSPKQWIILGLLSGLMVDVYYPNGVLLLIPLIEASSNYRKQLRPPDGRTHRFVKLAAFHLLYTAAFVVGVLPTLVSRWIIFGSLFDTGYPAAGAWKWNSPALWSVLWSADHGLLSWTPILIFALFGLVLFRRADRSFAAELIACFVAFYLLIAFYPDWDGISSFGNRFFVSLTPIFVIGLTAFFAWLATIWNERRARIVTAGSVAAFVLWNCGMMFQWGVHLIPPRGPISWRKTAYNQVAVVPRQMMHSVGSYFAHRNQLMQHIEETDIKNLKAP
jgi:Dolichyl-phosphate-mannose-protein mannosyltransferase